MEKMNENIIIYDWADAIKSKWPLEGVINRILAIGASAEVSFWLMKLLDKPLLEHLPLHTCHYLALILVS